MRVVVYEPTSSGHHFAWLHHVLPELAGLPCSPILLTTPSARRSPEFALHVEPLASRLEIDTSLAELDGRRGMAAWRHEFAELTAAIRRLDPNHLYVPYGEGVVRAAGMTPLLGRPYRNPSVVTEVFLVRGAFTYPAVSRRRRFGKRIAPWLIRRGPWDRIHHINPDDHAALAGPDGRFDTRCRLIPDGVEPPPPLTKAEARRALGIPEDGRYVGCVGNIGWRKGSPLLGAAFSAAAGRLRHDDRLLLAGPFEPDVRALIDRDLSADIRDGRVVLVDRLLTIDELNLAVTALNLVCTPYRNHPHSASVVIRAAVASRPVLGSAAGWMGRTITQFGLGATTDVNDGRAFADALVTALDRAGEYVPTEAARRFVRFHTVPNFVLHWTARLRQRLGRPEDNSQVDWSWVTEALSDNGAQRKS